MVHFVFEFISSFLIQFFLPLLLHLLNFSCFCSQKLNLILLFTIFAGSNVTWIKRLWYPICIPLSYIFENFCSMAVSSKSSNMRSLKLKVIIIRNLRNRLLHTFNIGSQPYRRGRILVRLPGLQCFLGCYVSVNVWTANRHFVWWTSWFRFVFDYIILGHRCNIWKSFIIIIFNWSFINLSIIISYSVSFVCKPCLINLKPEVFHQDILNYALGYLQSWVFLNWNWILWKHMRHLEMWINIRVHCYLSHFSWINIMLRVLDSVKILLEEWRVELDSSNTKTIEKKFKKHLRIMCNNLIKLVSEL